MRSEEFDILMAKALAGEETAEERRRLETFFAADPKLREEYRGLEAAWMAFRELGPLTEGLRAAPADLPEARLRQLQASVRVPNGSTPDEVFAPPDRDVPKGPAWLGWFERLGPWRFLAPLAFAVVVALMVVPTGRRPWRSGPPTHLGSAPRGPAGYLVVEHGVATLTRAGRTIRLTNTIPLEVGDRLSLTEGARGTVVTDRGVSPVSGPVEQTVLPAPGDRAIGDRSRQAVLAALFSPVAQLSSAGLLVTTRDAVALRLYSPRGATRSLTPTLLWSADSGRTYEVEITDELDPKTPTWQATNTVPPLAFASVDAWRRRLLKPDGLYRVRIMQTGSPLSTVQLTFRTLPDAAVPGEAAGSLSEACSILMRGGERTGDALAILLALPPSESMAELTLRLKLLAFGQLGFKEDYEDTLRILEASR